MQQLRDDQSSPDSVSTSPLLLVASICVASVANLCRRRYLYTNVTVESCLDFTECLWGWSPSAAITVERSIVMYNFSSELHHGHGIDLPLSHRLITEAATIVKFLMHQSVDALSLMDARILRRLYWLIYAGSCTSDMCGRQLLVLRQAHDQTSALIPADVSDAQLLEHYEPSSPDHIGSGYSYIPILNALSRLFTVWQSSQASPTQSMENLQVHIERTHRVVATLLFELSWKWIQVSDDFGFDMQTVNLKIA